MHLSAIKVSYQRIESGLRVWLMHAVKSVGCSQASLFKLFLSEPLCLWPWRRHNRAVTSRGKHLYKTTRTMTQNVPTDSTTSINLCLSAVGAVRLATLCISVSARHSFYPFPSFDQRALFLGSHRTSCPPHLLQTTVKNIEVDVDARLWPFRIELRIPYKFQFNSQIWWELGNNAELQFDFMEVDLKLI